MDLELFSRCLKDLVRSHDEVVVPGLGTFTAQNVPGSVDEEGTPVPPYRKISYSTVEKEDDGLFLRFLAKYLPEDADAAQTWQDFIEDFSGELDEKKSVVIEGVGELRASARKIYYFVSDTANFEYPDVPGQESVGALLPEEFAEEEGKSDGQDSEELPKPDELEATDTVEMPAEEPSAPQLPAVDESPEEDDEPEPSPQSRLIGNILLIVFVVIIFMMIAVTLLKDLPWMSNLLDHLLYTKEELQILGK